jgi:hypothetical protein
MRAELDEYGREVATWFAPRRKRSMIFGYLDPGTGSLILQALLGGIAGLAVAFKAWKSRFSLSRARAKRDGEGENPVDDSPLIVES